MATFKKASEFKKGMQGVIIHMSKQEALLLAALAGHLASSGKVGELSQGWYFKIVGMYGMASVPNPYLAQHVMSNPHWAPVPDDVPVEL